MALMQRSRSNHWSSQTVAAILSTVAPLSYDHAERTPMVVIGGVVPSRLNDRWSSRRHNYCGPGRFILNLK